MKAIAYSYWRTIKRGARTFDSIPASVQDDVKALARADVESGEITEEEYQTYIGEAYNSPTVTEEPVADTGPSPL